MPSKHEVREKVIVTLVSSAETRVTGLCRLTPAPLTEGGKNVRERFPRNFLPTPMRTAFLDESEL
jgi:hypothetical protein